jgi:hypothetical protein
MDNAPNISDVINVIMQNPEMLGMIKNLVSGNQQEKTEEASVVGENSDLAPETASEEAAPTAILPSEGISAPDQKSERRRQLLSALKPYLSPTRARAIDSMLGFTEIFDVIRKG